MLRKLYDCDICGKSVPIRSVIKGGEYLGKKACTYCKKKYDKPVKRNTVAKREGRECLQGFFSEAIKKLLDKPVCQNCGCDIKAYLHPQNNIAHILNKSKYKSVMCHPDNYVFLCDSKDNEDGSSCHGEFDSRLSGRPNMPVYNLCVEKFNQFSHLCEERGNERSIFENGV